MQAEMGFVRICLVDAPIIDDDAKFFAWLCTIRFDLDVSELKLSVEEWSEEVLKEIFQMVDHKW